MAMDVLRNQKRSRFFLIATFVLSLLIGVYGCTDVVSATDNGLIGYWSFDKSGEGKIVFTEGFEACGAGNVPAGWEGWATEISYFEVSDTRAYEGKKSMKLTLVAEDAASVLARSPKIPIEAGRYYSAVVNAFNETGESELYLEFWDESGRIGVTVTRNPLQGKWTEVVASGLAPEGSTHATLALYCHRTIAGVSYHDSARLIEAAIVEDLSGNENHGVASGGVREVKGRWGNALEFDGNTGNVSVPMCDALRSLDAITIEAWVYSASSHGGGFGGIVNNVNGSKDRRVIIKNDGTLMAQIHPKDTFIGPKIPDNVWTHIVYVYDGAEQFFYINGQFSAKAPYNGDKLPEGTYSLLIGQGHGTTYYFNGIIDDVKIYDRALTKDEIEYNFGNPPKWQGLMGYPNPFLDGEQVKLAYFADGEDEVLLFIYDEAGKVVRSIKGTAEKKGYNEMVWDGRNKTGDSVPTGVYVAIISKAETLHPLARGLLVKAF